MNDSTFPMVAIHILDGAGKDIGGDPRRLSRVPMVGEYVCLSSDQPLHKVIHVVHCAFDGDCDAEVVAEAKGVNRADILTPQSSAQNWIDYMADKARGGRPKGPVEMLAPPNSASLYQVGPGYQPEGGRVIVQPEDVNAMRALGFTLNEP